MYFLGVKQRSGGKSAPWNESLRRPVLGRELLIERAQELGLAHKSASTRVRPARLNSRLKENLSVLEKNYFKFSEISAQGEQLPSAALWLLDNFHTIENQVREIKKSLPKRYYKNLPRISSGAFVGFPRIFEISWEYVAHTDSVLTVESLTSYISAYQRSSILTIGELWAIPVMLRLVFLENLRRLVDSALQSVVLRNEVELIAQQSIDRPGLSGTDMLVSLAETLKARSDFVTSCAPILHRKLRAKGGPAVLATQWLEERIRELGSDPEELVRQSQMAQAADQVSVANVMTSIKASDGISWKEWFEEVSSIDKLLRRDEVYANGTFETRDLYRGEIEVLSRKSGVAEIEIAHRLIDFANHYSKDPSISEPEDDIEISPELSQHVGYFLMGDARPNFVQSLGIRKNPIDLFVELIVRYRTYLYVGSIFSISFALVIGLYFELIGKQIDTFWAIFASIVVLCPLSELVLKLVQWLLIQVVPPRRLARIDYSEGVPDCARTAVVVHAMLANQEQLVEAIEALEVRFVGNRDANIMLGILADLGDAAEETVPGDRALIEQLTSLVERLNRRYCTQSLPAPFFFMVRGRRWCASESKYICWERKRGKLMEFGHFITGEKQASFSHSGGDIERLRTIKFVITLDGDTQLPPGSAAKLIGSANHPMNLPRINQKTRIVEKGYGILQPRIGTSVRSSQTSTFARVMSGQVGIDPYTSLVSDLYHDVFRRSSYVGKGIYHVKAFQSCLCDRVPENQILSHDLFESLFARCGLVSDIELFDSFPARFPTYARRLHRWIRGDWQLLPWLLPRVPDANWKWYSSPLDLLAWWKLFDNFRRSLVEPAIVLMFILVWLAVPSIGMWWYRIYFAIMLFPIVAQSLSLVRKPWWAARKAYLTGILYDIFREFQRVALMICFLPHLACNSFHAILTVLYRSLVTRKLLLEWEPASLTEVRLGDRFRIVLGQMRVSWLLSILLVGLIWLLKPQALLTASPLLTLWIISPIVAWRVGLRAQVRGDALTLRDQKYLRAIAYRTWKYFDSLLKPEYNFLIPDNLQVVPKQVVAERTSPTNISLSMLAVVSAYDLGFIALPQAIDKIKGIFAGLQKLERFHGHYLNWYQIREARTLHPRYVSTVDSGNLAGHFISVYQALVSYPFQPIFSRQHLQHLCEQIGKNLDDVIENLNLQDSSLTLGQLYTIVNHLDTLFEDDPTLLAKHSEVKSTIDSLLPLVQWVKFIPQLQRFAERGLLDPKVRRIVRVLEGRGITLSLLRKITARLIIREPEIGQMELQGADRQLIAQFMQAVQLANDQTSAWLASIQSLCSDIESKMQEIDFKFLFDSSRKLLVIGMNLDVGRRDKNHYDLLASEARLASLVAIAKGDLPEEHWFALGRSLTQTSGGRALLSWSGTMFEYLMPTLVCEEFSQSLLGQTHKAVVVAQRRYAAQFGTPWGISESAYSGVDFEKTYQYKAFGVPGLGLKRGLADDLVVSPYSTALALGVDPSRSVANLRELERRGLLGEYGFYEAVDFTPQRLRADESSHIVRSYLAHHQGMSLAAINNVLNDNILRRRFHLYPIISANELLLQERMPTSVPLTRPHRAERLLLERVADERAERGVVHKSPHTAIPRLRVLSNGHYNLHLDNAGCGASNFNGEISLTRWSEDALKNNNGAFIYVRDLENSLTWSTTYQPTKLENESYEVVFNPEKVEYILSHADISTHTEVTISPEDPVEVRKVTISNLSDNHRVLDLTSYGEVVLGDARADMAHPAFAKLFVETEFLADEDAVIHVRRARSENETHHFLAHTVVMPVVFDRIQYETSRMKFIGRGRSLVAPQALESSRLSGTTGTVLDPIFSLRAKVELEPAQSLEVYFLNVYATTREELVMLVHKYKELSALQRVFELAWSQSDVELRHDQFSLKQVHAFHDLANVVLYLTDSVRAPIEMQQKNRLGQSSLWRFGLSGDDPIVLVILSDPDHLKLAHELLLAHQFLRMRGIRFDLVILNEYLSGYMQTFQEEIELLTRGSAGRDLIEKHGGIFLRSGSQLSDEERLLLQTYARVVLFGSKGSLARQLKLPTKVEKKPSEDLQPVERLTEKVAKAEDLEFWNEIGGFSRNGSAYEMRVSERRLPPHPWSNIIANEDFGFLVTESGGGYTWAINSRENRLTPWCNDPVCDPLSEVLYIRDSLSGEFWSLTPRPRSLGAEFVVTHGVGWTSFDSSNEGLDQSLKLFISPQGRIKWWNIELKNNTKQQRNLEVFLFVEWVLGVTRAQNFAYQRTSYDDNSQSLFVENPNQGGFVPQTAFIGSTAKVEGFTTSRREFIGRHGDVSAPSLLMAARTSNFLAQVLRTSKVGGVSLSNTVGAGFDGCGLLRVPIVIEPGADAQFAFFIGQADSRAQANELIPNLRTKKAVREAEISTHKTWLDKTSVVSVETPDRAFDIMINHWLLYQTLSCRMLARTAFYQSSGAIGFRDQLQDSLAFLAIDPNIPRKQILLHAGHQYAEGDVQHWWHPPSGVGIRTRITDNYLWLPYSVLQYLEATAEMEFLNEKAPFLQGPHLSEHQGEDFHQPELANHGGTIYEHCIIALDRAIELGQHQLPLIGHGDWNDGFNKVGSEGRGESVWLGWFLADSLIKFADIVEGRRDRYRATEYRKRAQKLIEAIEENAWDGNWYIRAFFDDGTPLGSHTQPEAKIDSLSQSWAVITGLGSKDREQLAFSEMIEKLVSERDQIIKLLDPPFNKSVPNPGYIQGYPPGIRENGGQYTHAATWVVIAAAKLKKGELAHHLFSIINPIFHGNDPAHVEHYKNEPYVTSGDVYSVGALAGHGGWSWYTGSSGWLYRAGLEWILGLKVRGDHFTVDPVIPSSWPGFRMRYVRAGVRYRIEVDNSAKVESGVLSLLINGEENPDKKVYFANFDATQSDVTIVVRMG